MNSEVGGAPAPSRTSGLAIASFVLGLLSCLCLPGPFAVILGIIALVQMGKDKSLKGQPFAIAGIALPVLMVPVAGILSAIAIPNFIKYQTRAKQSECRNHLKAIGVAERSRQASDQLFTEDFAELQWKPDGKTRYAYLIGRDAVEGTGALYPTMPAAVTERQVKEGLRRELVGGVIIGIDPDSPETFTAACVANLDKDSDFDVWSLSSIDREGPDGNIPAWTPYNEWNDMTDERGKVGE